MYNEGDLPVELHGSCVVDSEELVYTSHLGYVVGLAFAASLQTSYDGSILSAGEYTGIAEFTVSIAPKMD